MLNQEEADYIIYLIYNSSEVQAAHKTCGWDRFDKDALEKKLKEVMLCEEHVACRVLSKMMMILKDFKARG